jgi:uncharacterized membrane protein YqiK
VVVVALVVVVVNLWVEVLVSKGEQQLEKLIVEGNVSSTDDHDGRSYGTLKIGEDSQRPPTMADGGRNWPKTARFVTLSL